MKRLHKVLSVVLGVVAAGLAGSALLTRSAVREAEAKYPPRGEFMTAGGVRLHYLRAGSGQPVVFIHGNPGSTDDWTGVVAALGGERTTIVFDRPGHGYSERGGEDPGSPAAQAELFHRALEALGVSRPIVVGHSFGGGVAMAYALQFPNDVEAVVLAEPSIYVNLDRPPDTVYRVLETPVIGGLLAWTIVPPLARGLVAKGLARAFSPAPVPEDYLARAQVMWSRPTEGRATANDSLRRRALLPELSARYRDLKMPVTILSGEQDQMAVPEEQAHRLHRELPAARFIAIADGGHMVPHTHAALVADTIRTATSTSGQAAAIGVARP